ncbi:MAG: hypothetical protein HYZ29_23315 [Myxococcales bacterium]|nr:hypothetical protein [Myxococcales bacterium]
MPAVGAPFAQLQSAILQGLAQAAPAAATEAVKRLVPLLGSLDKSWPFVVIAARAFDMARRSKRFPTPEQIGRYLTASASEFASERLAAEWMRLKPFWKEQP